MLLKTKICTFEENSDKVNLGNHLVDKQVLEDALIEMMHKKPKGNFGRIIGDITHETEPLGLSGVSHEVDNINIVKDDGIYTTINVLDTPSGKALQEAINAGAKITIHPTVYGYYKEDNVIDKIIEIKNLNVNYDINDCRLD